MQKLIVLFLLAASFCGRAIAAPCDQSTLANAPAPAQISPPLVPGAPALQLAYHATFTGGSLDCFMDRIRPTPQALQKGDGQVPGETVSFTGGTQGLVLGLTAPSPIPPIPGHAADDTQTPSVGVFSTGLNYGPGTFFSARATFKAPNGPFGDGAWAVGLNARTGGKDDLWSEHRLNVTLKFKKGAASLNVFDDGASAGTSPVPAGFYKSIISSSQPFTIELIVNRMPGLGAAILTTAGAAPVTLQFALKNFGPKSGPVVNAIGPALATCCVEAMPLSVELTDFQILVHPSTPPRS